MYIDICCVDIFVVECNGKQNILFCSHSASNSGGMGTRGISANFDDDPNKSMPSAGGNRLPPIVGEENEMRETSKKTKKKTKKSKKSGDSDTDIGDHHANRIDNTDLWDVL